MKKFIIIFVFMSVIIPLSLYVVFQQQELRKRAAETPVLPTPLSSRANVKAPSAIPTAPAGTKSSFASYFATPTLILTPTKSTTPTIAVPTPSGPSKIIVQENFDSNKLISSWTKIVRSASSSAEVKNNALSIFVKGNPVIYEEAKIHRKINLSGNFRASFTIKSLSIINNGNLSLTLSTSENTNVAVTGLSSKIYVRDSVKSLGVTSFINGVPRRTFTDKDWVVTSKGLDFVLIRSGNTAIFNIESDHQILYSLSQKNVYTGPLTYLSVSGDMNITGELSAVIDNILVIQYLK